MTDRKYTGIASVTAGVNTETNILDVDIWAVTDEGNEDLVEVLFTPNTIEGIGFKQWAKGWLIRVVTDGWTDIWDDYLSDDGEGSVIVTFVVTFDIVTAGVVGTEVWTFQASKSYIQDRENVGVEIEQKRTPGEIFVLCIGTADITYP